MSRPFPTDSPMLRGPWAPWPMEGEIRDCAVVGEIPRDLNGTLYRNGPNPQFAPPGSYHFFLGDGMVHAFSFEDGRCHYRNRWVRTPRFEAERAAGEPLFGNLFDGRSQRPARRGHPGWRRQHQRRVACRAPARARRGRPAAGGTRPRNARDAWDLGLRRRVDRRHLHGAPEAGSRDGRDARIRLFADRAVAHVHRGGSRRTPRAPRSDRCSVPLDGARLRHHEDAPGVPRLPRHAAHRAHAARRERDGLGARARNPHRNPAARRRDLGDALAGHGSLLRLPPLQRLRRRPSHRVRHGAVPAPAARIAGRSGDGGREPRRSGAGRSISTADP